MTSSPAGVLSMMLRKSTACWCPSLRIVVHGSTNQPHCCNLSPHCGAQHHSILTAARRRSLPPHSLSCAAPLVRFYGIGVCSLLQHCLSCAAQR
jgi:hypothetical protein